MPLVAELPDHLEIEARALLQALRFDELVGVLEHLQPMGQFVANLIEDREYPFPRRHVVGLREDGITGQPVEDLSGQRVERTDVVDLVVEQLDAHRLLLGLGREDVDDVAAHAIRTALEGHVVARVLQLRQAVQDVALVDTVASVEVQHHAQVGLRIAEAVDRGHGRDNHGVAPFEQRLGRGQAHLLNVRVYRRVLLDVRVRGRHVSLGL